MVCSLCGSKKNVFLSKIFDFEYNLNLFGNYFSCENCQTIFKDKKKFKFGKLYDKKKYIPTSNNFFYSFLKNINAYFEAKKILKHKKILFKDKILDIGCGNAYLIRNLSKLSPAKYFGIDLNVNFKNTKNIKIFKQNIKNFDFITRINPNIIILNNYLEHLEDKKKMMNLFKRIPKKTTIIVLTPDIDSNARKIFKKYWSGYHAPRHYFVFSKNSFVFMKKEFSLKLNHISKMYDPFANIISSLNLIKFLIYKKSYLYILSNFFLIIKGLLSDLINLNRIFVILEKR